MENHSYFPIKSFLSRKWSPCSKKKQTNKQTEQYKTKYKIEKML